MLYQWRNQGWGLIPVKLIPLPIKFGQPSVLGGGSVVVDQLFLTLFVCVLYLTLVLLFTILCPSSIAMILMGNRELIAILSVST